ncbi:hypothetical protein [Silvibacterium dinghuense]|uniref:Uncharacterized protein n=1 Tax=Silvibacterium dinghuense TaxID=1560006 RepID=A0A4Q1SI96_9BACT|nr:hypothetical protein [Silvibacterium dinghuense]RXS97099.1 hypothetical protein ESZ00_04025 [Silvibacterium dinghuense]GGG96205.1 hypothetical protein GCM10011586_09170 [Silvibacterium dinghuense]
MARNLYILAATLLLFSLISCGMVWMGNSDQPGLAGNGSLWKTIALFLLVGSLITALCGMMTAMFEQVERRNEEQRRRERAKRR